MNKIAGILIRDIDHLEKQLKAKKDQLNAIQQQCPHNNWVVDESIAHLKQWKRTCEDCGAWELSIRCANVNGQKVPIWEGEVKKK